MTAAITIVGLGPGPVDLRTVRAQQALETAEHIFVRGHGDVDLSDLLSRPNVTNVRDFHDINATNRWHRAAEVIIASARVSPVVLTIPGHPRFGEGLVDLVLAQCEELGITTEVIDGISATDMLASALNIDPIHHRVQLIAGWALRRMTPEAPFDGGLVNLSPHLPVLITHVYDHEALTATQQQLLRIFPADHPVEMISSAGLDAESRLTTTVGELPSQSGGWLLALYVPALGELIATRAANSLQHIMARLRREDGCPWDRKQTNASLAPTLVDEVYEIIDAINAGDDANLCEELGDLLMLIMMHAQIAEERGAFTLEDVYHGIVTKIVRRHPHVFGDDAAANAEEVVGLWQRVKAEEKKTNPKPEKANDGQPHSMPALDRAVRVLKKHPIEITEVSSGDERQRALLDAVAAIVAVGDDPNKVLKSALIDHVNVGNAADEER
ncbi:MAG: MazG family protein [Thermomicrobiales bacterium]|nr:MazG family protein [Thermomicrobiales bacterium]MCO5226252.1 MazG family protein [Thermomicrobiales bacterium]MCO5228718.1 MazG family protein [Thermomicrobiales bacterium]